MPCDVTEERATLAHSVKARCEVDGSSDGARREELEREELLAFLHFLLDLVDDFLAMMVSLLHG